MTSCPGSLNCRWYDSPDAWPIKFFHDNCATLASGFLPVHATIASGSTQQGASIIRGFPSVIIATSCTEFVLFFKWVENNPLWDITPEPTNVVEYVSSSVNANRFSLSTFIESPGSKWTTSTWYAFYAK